MSANTGSFPVRVRLAVSKRVENKLCISSVVVYNLRQLRTGCLSILMFLAPLAPEGPPCGRGALKGPGGAEVTA